ncbi:peptidoglycan-binding protein [Microvirga sp. 17 mud 1-3]|uniref:peptidoglycan-binding protein n=1 Tax=Microvirga sp. 17 mud 1-3 TaxID=2082949 RepID=UPI000D6D8D6B|nr:peptidoglycan-binding protein [Microvirga sp. 17 mud 1-3]AWM88174.1 serine protease [Microvirga sp. 17 mud 1-3]
MNRACLRPILHLCVALASLGAGAGLPAKAQPAPAARTPDPAATEAARGAFEALPEAERRAIQESLIWSGDYSGVADGTFGRQTFEAIAAFQRRAGRPATGIPSAADRTALQAGLKSAVSAAGFETLMDARTGVRIGVPSRLLVRQGDNPNGGSRWQSPDGKITLDTRVAPADATLASLYERNLAIKTPGRAVTYKVLRPDFFVIAGETPTGKFYTRYADGPGGIRAFSIGYDKSVAAQTDRLVVAIANSFVPFPESSPAAPAPTVAQSAPVPRAAPGGGSAPFGTGLAVGTRQVLTAAPVDRCKEVRVGDVKVQQVKGSGPFLLETVQDLNAKPAQLSTASSSDDGAPVLVLAFGNDGEGLRLNAVAGTRSGKAALAAPLQPGASGAPVFDGTGALTGFVGALPANPRKVAGIVPSTLYPVVPAPEAIKIFPSLAAGGARPAAPMSAADLVSTMRASAVALACTP